MLLDTSVLYKNLKIWISQMEGSEGHRLYQNYKLDICTTI